MKKTISKIALWVFAVLALCGSAAANQLANPGFIPTDPSDYMIYGLIAPPQWTNIGGANGPLPNNVYSSDGTNPFPVPTYKGNNYFYDLGGYGNAVPAVGEGVQQTFDTVPGHRYTLTFGFSSEANGFSADVITADQYEAGIDSLLVSVGDQNQVFNAPYQAGSPGYGVKNTGTSGDALVGSFQMPWVTRSVTFTASSNRTTVFFKVNSVSSLFYLDEPEGFPNGANSVMIAMPDITEVSPTITVIKELIGNGRINSSADQFTVAIKKAGVVQNDTAHSTTQGSGSSVTTGSGTTGVFTALADTDYTIDEVMAAGSTSSLNQYSTKVVCTNALVGGTDVSGTRPLGTHLTLKASDAVTCRVQNEPAIRLTIHKTSKGGVGSFTFKGTSNANGFSTDNSYIVTTTQVDVAADGATVKLTSANTLSEVQEVLPSGWTLSSANCVDSNAANPNASFGTVTNGSTMQIPAANVVAGANINCTFTNTSTGFAVSGKIILDTGVNSGMAHDAIQNGGEVGHSGVPLSLTNCGSTVYSTTTSAGDGSFSLGLSGVPAGQAVCLVEFLPFAFQPVSVNVGTTTGVYTVSTTTLKFTPAANTSYSNVVLGNAPLSTFVSDGAQQAPAGQAVTYAHVYVAGSSGRVVFSTANGPTPSGWSSVLYRDFACNGTLEAPDAVLPPFFDVNAGERICILDRVFSPAWAIEGAKNTTTVTARETWTVSTLTPGSQDHALLNTDTTTVGLSGLTLLKDFRNVTTCPVDAAGSIANTALYDTHGSANPGQFLEYRLRYSNSTAAPLTNIKINDVVPAYTQFVKALCLALPSTGIGSCSVTQPAPGAIEGAILWAMTDATSTPVGLQPLASGSVSFCVKVQQ